MALPNGGSTFRTHINKLKIMQKKIMRAIVGAKCNAHTSDIFHHLRILKIYTNYTWENTFYHI